ncbi:Ctr copper transporter family-domain-containing protein [Sphaerosporella brunnea]|uniref:Copper transport protein n=1 Tax=Sphaerosporella brunnea TaxID=1250544 RepID=A0A5J5EVL5_9PEZI|nr:Ctr copper transporter family-domain-containing protein [Sphaerosporella brunnea]
MDHSHHHHHAMDDAGSMDMNHGGGMSGHRCQMSMLFTWNTQDLCLVFRWWHVTSMLSLILSLLAVVALGMGYEYLRAVSRRYEARLEAEEVYTEQSSLLPGTLRANSTAQRRKRGNIGKALLYGAQVFYSFFIMLLFMTYNGWVMIAVAVGAAAGYLVWGAEESAAKIVACH